jgi:6-phosphogluconolactonase
MQNNILIAPSAEELAASAAKLIIEIAKNAIQVRDKFVISLSGGHTPEQLYTLLSKPPFVNEIPWNKTFIFWGDERCVALDDVQNNANMAKITLLNHVEIPQANINAIPVNLPPEKAASQYEETIYTFFGSERPCFDLVLLGLGENGHTASLFPGNNAILNSARLIEETYVAEQKMFRITMTSNLINEAHNVLFLVAGSEKASILKTVLTEPYQPNRFPAQEIKPKHGNLYWLVDSKAAALLPDHVLHAI